MAAAYLAFYPVLCEVARAHGYCLAIHGTLGRDMDLIAIPWTEDAADAPTLITALKEKTGSCTHGWENDRFFKDCAPTDKPHGRKAYSLHLTERGSEGAYFDVSVMPKISKVNVDIV